jgi:hypothetical protein
VFYKIIVRSIEDGKLEKNEFMGKINFHSRDGAGFNWYYWFDSVMLAV